jgi:hypothetical protein
MKKLSVILWSLLLVFGLSGFANALTYGSIEYVERDYSLGSIPYSGEYLFTVIDPINDNLVNVDDLEGLVEQETGLSSVELDFYDKVEEPDLVGENGDLTITYGAGDVSGTWTSSVPIEFYIVKSSTEWAMYWLEELASSGDWSTGHLLNNGGTPQISHLTALNPGDTPPPVVPEPSTILLLGAGLLGLGVYSRKRGKK